MQFSSFLQMRELENLQIWWLGLAVGYFTQIVVTSIITNALKHQCSKEVTKFIKIHDLPMTTTFLGFNNICRAKLEPVQGIGNQAYMDVSPDDLYDHWKPNLTRKQHYDPSTWRCWNVWRRDFGWHMYYLSLLDDKWQFRWYKSSEVGSMRVWYIRRFNFEN